MSARRQGSEPRALQLSPFTHQMVLWVYSSRDQWREYRDNIYGRVIHGWPSTTGYSSPGVLPYHYPPYLPICIFILHPYIYFLFFIYIHVYILYVHLLYIQYVYIYKICNIHGYTYVTYRPFPPHMNPRGHPQTVNIYIWTWEDILFSEHMFHVNLRGHPRTVNTYMTQERTQTEGMWGEETW
jgi:hypothetical protein